MSELHDDAWHRAHPIFGTDFSKPPSILVEEARIEINRIRGKLGDIGHGYSLFRQQLEDVEGLLTCGLHVLYDVAEKMKECESRGSSMCDHFTVALRCYSCDDDHTKANEP